MVLVKGLREYSAGQITIQCSEGFPATGNIQGMIIATTLERA
jgi:hypothetical protein